MAAAHMPPPCALRSTWGASHSSCSCGAGVPGGEGRRGSNVGFSLKKLGCSSKKFRPYLPCEAGRWRRTGICTARFDFRGNSAEQAKEEDASTLSEMSALVDDLSKLTEVVNEANKGIGADVRNRVDVLYNRATLLKYSADRMVDGGGRVPVQLSATLKGLQREHASVENIVRLAMEAGPVIPDTESSPSKLNSFPIEAETVAVDDQNQALNGIRPLIEKEERKPSLFESLTRQSSLKVEVQPKTSETGDYVMSTPAAKDSSPLAAFRKEIERRVMEQLSGKKTLKMEPDVASIEKEKELAKGDAKLEDDNVLGLLQNLPLRGRLPRRRERGAGMNEAQAADTFTGEVDAPEAQPQILEDTQDAIILPDDEQQQASVVETESNSKELEKLRSDLSILERQLSYAKEGSARADTAEAQLQQLTEKMAATVPLDVHDQVVKLERESLSMARTKIAQVTTELKEKESMLRTVKKDMIAEQENLLNKVRELSGELSKRVSAEEVEAAVNNAVHELEKELGNALKRAESMRVELETNEKLLKQLQKEWDAERTSLRGELANMKGQLTELQMEQASDRAKLKEALERVNGLEDSVNGLEQAMVEAEEDRIIREKNVLATVRSLVADMVKTKRAQAKSGTLDSKLLEATNSSDRNDKNGAGSAEDILATMFSGEKAVALETFFVMMGTLIQQESERMESNQSREVDNSAGFRESKDDYHLSNVKSSRVDSKRTTKRIITLYYESSWEFAYLHYSADGAEWTALPGVCMRNGLIVNNMPLKAIDVEGSKLEFVLTDGRGSWDCAPRGGNYHIKNSGTFLLSSGFIEQKR